MAGAETARYATFDASLMYAQEKQNNNALALEMAYLRRNWEREGLVNNWFDLPETGFMINTQIGFLAQDLQSARSSIESKKISQGWLEKTEADMRSFILEYLANRLVFPIYYTIEEIDGKPSIINTLHGQQKKLKDTISKKERNGAVWDTFVNTVEPFLLKASDGSIAVVDSPSGPSGFVDEGGKPITYPDSQTYILQKRGNEIVGFTIKTDFTLQEHAELLKRLRRYSGQEEPHFTKLEDFITQPALFAHAQMPLAIKDVVNIMRDVRFGLSGGSLYAFEKKLWSEVYADIRRGSDLWRYDSMTDEYIADFKQYFLEHNWSYQDLKEALASTILRISRFVKGKDRKVGGAYDSGRYYSYGNVLHDVQMIAGCAGGGSKNKLIFSLTPRIGTTRLDRSLEEDCLECQMMNVCPCPHVG